MPVDEDGDASAIVDDEEVNLAEWRGNVEAELDDEVRGSDEETVFAFPDALPIMCVELAIIVGRCVEIGEARAGKSARRPEREQFSESSDSESLGVESKGTSSIGMDGDD